MSETFPRTLRSLRTLGIAGIVIGMPLLLFAFSNGVSVFYHSYIFGWFFWMEMSIGCYGLMLLQNMVRAHWGRPLIRMFESGAKMLPLLGLLGIPLIAAVFTHHLYPWAKPNVVASDPILQHRVHYFGAYMSPVFFTIRMAAFFAVFSGVTYILALMARTQDITKDKKLEDIRASIAAPMFLLMFLLVTFGVTDWVMSLDKHWYSTIYGLYICISSALLAMSFAVLLVCRGRMAKEAPYDELITPQMTKDFGNLLLMMTMVWAYFSISQYLITWSGNLPQEVEFFLRRNSTFAFATFTTVMVIFHFFVPFLLLLSGRTKRVPTLLMLTVSIEMAACLVDVAWNIIPMFHSMHAGLAAQFEGGIFYLAAFLGIGGLWLVGFVSALQRGALVPTPAAIWQEEENVEYAH